MKRFVIIGNGPAANSAAEAIRKQDQASSVTMFSREFQGHYYTPALPELVSGEKTAEKLIVHGPQWYERLGIELRLDCPVQDADPERRLVITAEGEEVGYDALLLATGGNAFVPPIPGTGDLKVIPGVFTLRTMADAERIKAAAGQGRRVVLIGGGLLGLEAGNGLLRIGAHVEVVEVFPRLLPRQTDSLGAKLLQGLLETMGFAFHLGRKTERIARTPDGLEVLLDNGTSLAADMILISAGVRPELELAGKLGLAVDKAVLVDDRMRTSLADVYAAGDVCEHRGRYYGIWPAAVEQGRVAGTNMAGGSAEYAGTVPSNSLKVAGIALTAFGEIDAEGRHQALVFQGQANGLYRKVVHNQGRMLGGIFLGDEQGARTALTVMRRDQILSPEIRALFPAESA
ncbi:NAD(P)/FAD-dependent oxidoreductase [Desulfonatronum sp. SC1]|uniref:NAD(P)/FAD-dependent oxidoreductase n=1 Tax=Desulfonatronum sp. SC1 TaxID=2109626 RepID=UPI000D3056AB|nr:FAD-dependent oxidoreductase [Desulfonatronum sp. SC1]PTN35035.1 NAD(P)/FAD-dependent oxidoreductase [Desulfonatronum sp. SC1]